MVCFVLPLTLKTTASNKINDIDNKIEEKNSSIKDLENRAAVYRDQIKNLQSQAQSLQNEVELFDAQIAQLELESEATEIKIGERNLEIEKLQEEIDVKEKDIEKEKFILKDLIRELNDYDSNTMFEVMLKNEAISNFFNETDYVNAVGEKIKNALDTVKNDKIELENKRQQATVKKEELEELKEKIESNQDAMISQKAAKEEFLNVTKGSEDKYRNLLSGIMEQKKSILGDVSKLMAEKQKEIAKIAAESNRPTSSGAVAWYFSQNDPRWKDDYIGVSNSTINDYGCALTSLAMVFRYRGIDINPKVMAKQPIFVRDLISWPAQWRFLNLDYNSYHKSGGLGQSEWEMIDEEIAAGNPVIVFIRALGRNAGHYVVIYGKDTRGYIVNDPIMWNGQSGASIYLATTRKYVEAVYRTNTVVDQVIVYK
jgi:peptidoglycan hydrolase CwlO-like protein